MSANTDYLVTFPATSAAMRAEKCCQNKDIKASLRPVPRELSSSCGLALEVQQLELARLQEILNSHNIDTEAIYRPEEEYKKVE